MLISTLTHSRNVFFFGREGHPPPPPKSEGARTPMLLVERWNISTATKCPGLNVFLYISAKYSDATK